MFIQLELEGHAYPFFENYKVVSKHIVGPSNSALKNGQRWIKEITGWCAISLCSMGGQERDSRSVKDLF